MATTNIIRQKYGKLIHLISQISDDVRIEDKWTRLSLTIDVYSNKRNLLSFKLYQLSETDDTLSIAWGVLYRNIGHWTFPDYFTQDYMFNRLISVIMDWYQEVVDSNLNVVLRQAQNITTRANNSSEKKDADEEVDDLSFTDGHFGIDYLSLEQKYALLYEMTFFIQTSSMLQNKKEEATELLDKFRDILRLNYIDIGDSHYKQLIHNKEQCDEIVKTIDIDGPFIPFITYCMMLMELDNYSNFIFEKFHNLLLDIGYTEDEAEIICNCDFVFRFK